MIKFPHILIAGALALVASSALADDTLCPATDTVKQSNFVSVTQQKSGWKAESNPFLFQGNNWKVGMMTNLIGAVTPDVALQKAQQLLHNPNVVLQAQYRAPGQCGYFFQDFNGKLLLITAYIGQ